MDLKNQLITFLMDTQLLAIPIQVVERIVRAVEVTPLRKAPEGVLGILDYHGEILPVLSLRKRLRFPDRSLVSSDRFMILRTDSLSLVVVVDEIHEVIPSDNQLVTDAKMLNEAMEAEGITRCEDGLILIYDPDKFLSSSEAFNLKKALRSMKKKEIPND